MVSKVRKILTAVTSDHRLIAVTVVKPELLFLQKLINELGSETVLIKAWAECKFCQILDEAESLAALSQLTVWTIQRLVELKAQHKGSVNLLELKPCLQEAPFGEDADAKVNRYLDKVWEGIKLRSHLVRLVKKYLEDTRFEKASIDALHGAYFGSTPPQRLEPQEMHEILIELSSPLTGYLGRIKGSDWRRDRFYFLRDLPTD